MEAGEACARQPLRELRSSLVAEALAEREPEKPVPEPLLGTVPGELQAVFGVELFDEQQAAGSEPGACSGKQRVPLPGRNPVENVEDRDEVELACDGVVERRN